MKFWMAPTKKQLILLSAITLCLILYPMVSIFFGEDFSNRQYLIFGGLAFLGLVNLIIAVGLYKSKKQSLVSK